MKSADRLGPLARWAGVRTSSLLLVALSLAGCAGSGEVPGPQAPLDWRAIATPSDRERMRGLRAAWMEALARARAAGHGAEIVREGALLEPEGVIAQAPLPPGDYRCRTIKIGAKSRGMLDYVAYQPFLCRVRDEGGAVSFQKVSGSQRPIGFLFPDGGGRMVFLGTLQLGDEAESLEYGTDEERDMIAALERVGERRWRLTFPKPHFESMLDLIELVPAT